MGFPWKATLCTVCDVFAMAFCVMREHVGAKTPVSDIFLFQVLFFYLAYWVPFFSVVLIPFSPCTTVRLLLG